MNRLAGMIRTFLRVEEGASIGEYAVLLALIAIVTLATIVFIGTTLSGFFASAASSI